MLFPYSVAYFLFGFDALIHVSGSDGVPAERIHGLFVSSVVTDTGVGSNGVVLADRSGSACD